MQTELVARGWQVRTVDLLSVADRGYLRLGLHDDAEMVRQRIKEINGPVVVVAHSYGGARAASKSWVCRGIALHGHDVVVDVPPVGFTAAEP